MDGVLVDSERHWQEVEFVFLKNRIPGWNLGQHKKIMGMSVPDLYALLRWQFKIKLAEREFARIYNQMAEEIYRGKVSLVPGCLEFIRGCQAEAFRLAIASSSPMLWIDIVMGRFDLASYFEAIVSADHISCKSKPQPDIFIHTAKRLDQTPADCVVIEDSQNGVTAAKKAKMKCIGFRNGHNDEQDLSEADLIVGGFGELSADAVRKL